MVDGGGNFWLLRVTALELSESARLVGNVSFSHKANVSKENINDP